MYLKQLHKVRVDFDVLEFGDQTAEEVLAYKGVLFTGYATFGSTTTGKLQQRKNLEMAGHRDGEMSIMLMVK